MAEPLFFSSPHDSLKSRALEPSSAQVLSSLKFDKRNEMPEDYADAFRKAIAVFHHARIYDAKTRSVKPLQPLEQKHMKALNGELDILGPELPASIAAAIAEGHLNPVTMEAFNSFPDAETGASITSMESWVLVARADQDQPFVLPKHASQANKKIHNLEINERIFTDTKASSENVLDNGYDEDKYMKEARALGRLIVPTQCRQLAGQEVVRAEVPNNNPFKKRKIESCSPKVESWSEHVTVLTNAEKSTDVFCSSLNSQESVGSKPDSVLSVGKHKTTNNCKAKSGDEKGVDNTSDGIFRFFQRL